jgi:hypothetical protein
MLGRGSARDPALHSDPEEESRAVEVTIRLVCTPPNLSLLVRLELEQGDVPQLLPKLL